MFWANNYVSSPHIEALLNKEDITLHELMDEGDILQECRSLNKKLIDYLTRSDVMEELILLTTKEPSTDIVERWRYKYPNIACELLTCDVPILNEKLAGDETLLAKLYSFIETDQPLNPLLASFFSKTIGVLVTRKTDQVLEFLKSRLTCVDLLLQHLETSAIMDLILKLVTRVEGSDTRQNMLNWLNSQQLVQRLVKLLSPSSESSKHANAAQLLCDMITETRENQRTSTKQTDSDPILNTLESEDTVSLLLETILNGEKLESSIVGGIQVLLTLLGKKANNALNEGDIHGNGIGEDVTDNEQRMKISNATLPYLEQLHKLLLDPPYKPPIKTTVGVLECPLGNTRIHVAKLFTALMTVENVKIYETLVELGTFQTLLDLFFTYTWNNFLHTQVQLCLALAVNCDFKDTNDIIYNNIFIKCKLIDRILKAYVENDAEQYVKSESHSIYGIRQGYMGHLINIANNIVNQCKKSEDLDNFLKANLPSKCLYEWNKFVNVQLVIINKTHQVMLSGEAQPFKNNSSENPDDFSSNPQEDFNRTEQYYANYLKQHMGPQFVGNFGFDDDEFNKSEGDLHNSVDQLTTLAFTLSEENHEEREDMFKKICQEKQNVGLEDCSAVGEWGDELTYQTVVDKEDWPTKQQHNDSNSFDEDDEGWNTTEPLSTGNNTLPEVNPWDSAPSETVEPTGWANFDNFENTLSVENTVIIDNKLCDEIKKETPDTSADLNKTEDVVENKVTVEATIGAGDVKVEESVDSTSLNTETNVNHKSIEDSLFPVCTADKNANPSEISDTSETTCGENIMNKELETTTVQNEKSSNEYKISCSLDNASSEAVLPPTDAK